MSEVRPPGRDSAAGAASGSSRRRRSSPRRCASRATTPSRRPSRATSRELGLVKVRNEERPARLRASRRGRPLAARRARLGAAPLGALVDPSGNLVVILTPSGYANALAQAIDERGPPDIAGTVAGDNTIFVAAREGVTRRRARRPAATSSGRRSSDRHRRARLLGRARHELRDRVAEGGLRLRRGGRRPRRRRTGRDFEPAIERGKAAGADDVVLLDRKEAFAEEQVAKALLANALYEGKYPLVSALSRPVIAEAVAEVALELGAEAVVHGCTGKGNDQLRFELAFKAKYPGVKVIAPLRDHVWTRDAEIAYAEERGIPVEAKAGVAVLDRRQSLRPRDRGRHPRGPVGGAARGGVRPHRRAGGRPRAGRRRRRVRARSARCHRRRGAAAPRARRRPQRRAGSYGIGRIDMIENRAVGIKSRELYEAPAALTLIAAHRALEELVLTKGELEAQARARTEVGEARLRRRLVRAACASAYDAFFATTQELVTGDVRLSLQPGAAVVTGRRSEHALYAESLASYGIGETFPHDAAEGFIADHGARDGARRGAEAKVAVA